MVVSFRVLRRIWAWGAFINSKSHIWKRMQHIEFGSNRQGATSNDLADSYTALSQVCRTDVPTPSHGLARKHWFTPFFAHVCICVKTVKRKKIEAGNKRLDLVEGPNPAV